MKIVKKINFKKFIYVFLFFIFIYLSFEILLRIILPFLFGFVIELNTLAQDKSIKNYNEHYFSKSGEYLDSIIGFKRNYKDIKIKKNNKKKLIITGSSITGGSGTEKRFSSYLSDSLKDNYQIYNFSTENHGIYQISYSVKTNSTSVTGDLNLIATVPHSLSRPGKNYMSFYLRPIFFINQNNELNIIKYYDYEKFIRSYINSKKYFYNNLWISKFFFDNRRYYFANLYESFYEKIYTESILNIVDATNNESKSIIILLPSNFKFRYKNFFIKTFKKTINNFSHNKNIVFIEINQCVMNFFKLNKKDYLSYNIELHPDKFVHESYAKCILLELKKRELIS